MNPAPPAPAARVRTLGGLATPALCALGALIYAGGHLAWYLDTPLGRFPVVDEQENLALTEAIVRGELPREPFYRAMAYPLLLSLLRLGGVEATGLFTAALVFGVVLHAVNAALAARIAGTWFGRAGALAAGLLTALNPVFVHYATQALDATPALTCFLLGLSALSSELSRTAETQARVRPWILASIAWAAATALRPNYLLVWCSLPVLAFWILRGPARRTCALAALTGGGLFLCVAVWQWRVSGAPGFLPWQGTYNLWAANQPGAHGRYFVQRVAIPSSVGGLNTTRAESIFLYRQETGAAPSDPTALNAHWRRRFVAYVTGEPFAWLRQLAGKTYALLNSWEQYNNKTFAFHQARSPWLAWNPLGWGVLLVAGVLGGYRLGREHPAAARALALTFATCATGVLLFFVSARFRLPLAALLTLLAAGAAASPLIWRTWPRRAQLALGVTLFFFGLLTFSSFGDIRDRRTFVEDHALLARAAAATGDEAQAWTHATAALALDPSHRDAQRVAVSSYFNHLVRHGSGPAPEPKWRELCQRFLAVRDPDVRDLQALAALALWRAGDRTGAFDEWIRLGATPSALAARLIAGDRNVNPADLAALRRGWDEPLVRLAAARLGLATPDGRPAGDSRRAAEILALLFAPPPTAPPRS